MLVAFLGALTPLGHAEASIEILETGTFHESEVEFEQAGEWFCLVKHEQGYELRMCEVAIEPAYDVIADDNTGKKVSAEGMDPLVLVRGVLLEAGPIKTCFSGQHFFLHPEYRTAAVLEGCSEEAETTIQIQATGQVAGRLNSPLVTEFALHMLRNRDREQIIEIGHVKDSMPSLRWAGDLDRDGFVDFLMEVSDHYNCQRPALFLSGTSPRPGFVGQPITFTYCGC